jgi:hypothetical protein
VQHSSIVLRAIWPRCVAGTHTSPVPFSVADADARANRASVHAAVAEPVARAHHVGPDEPPVAIPHRGPDIATDALADRWAVGASDGWADVAPVPRAESGAVAVADRRHARAVGRARGGAAHAGSVARSHAPSDSVSLCAPHAAAIGAADRRA